jgi:hypothetical protein
MPPFGSTGDDRNGDPRAGGGLDLTQVSAGLARAGWTCRVTGHQLEAYDLELEVLLRAEPTAEQVWLVQMWATPTTAGVSLGYQGAGRREMVTLALPVLALDNATRTELVTPSSDADQVDQLFVTALRDAANRTRDQVTLAPLLARVPGLQVHTFGGAMPVQAEGTWHGYPFYFRYRRGYATLELGAPVPGDQQDGRDPVRVPLWSAEVAYGDRLQGVLTEAEFADLFCQVAGRLRRADFAFRFYPAGHVGRRLGPEDGYDPARVVVRAPTLLDAQRLLRTDPMWADREFEEIPVELDNRVFPEEAPDFTVLPPRIA